MNRTRDWRWAYFCLVFFFCFVLFSFSVLKWWFIEMNQYITLNDMTPISTTGRVAGVGGRWGDRRRVDPAGLAFSSKSSTAANMMPLRLSWNESDPIEPNTFLPRRVGEIKSWLNCSHQHFLYSTSVNTFSNSAIDTKYKRFLRPFIQPER